MEAKSLVIDDKLRNVEAARRLGINAVLATNNGRHKIKSTHSILAKLAVD